MANIRWPLRSESTAARWHALAAAALVALLILRVWAALTLRVNSDEPQHLHIVWCWTQGILPYRDVFDNHAPLFHILYAPLLAALGERADIVPLMRLAVLPWYALCLLLTWRLGATLFGRRAGWIALALVALHPTFFARSVEFRPDDAWAAAWLAAIVVAVSGTPSVRRGWLCGLLGGIALAFSIKSTVLIGAALVAAGMVLLILRAQRRTTEWPRTIQTMLATAAGGAVLPATIGVAFAAAGGWEAIRYCLFVHNVAAGLGRWSHAGFNAWIFPLLLPPLGYALFRTLRRDGGELHSALRGWGVATALIYLALRASYQPLLDKQDVLPVVPMLAPFAAALLLRLTRGWSPARSLATVVVIAAAEGVLSLRVAQPWNNDARPYTQELQTLLRLSRPGDYVMDDKAESIFRRRPFYWVLENVTLYRIAQGNIADDIPARLAADRVGVGVFDRERGADRDFVKRNYVEVAPHVGVAGHVLGAIDAGTKIEFDVGVPNRYVLLASNGRSAGLLDGAVYDGPRELREGRHEFIPEHDGVWALEAARAAALGYRPLDLVAGAAPSTD